MIKILYTLQQNNSLYFSIFFYIIFTARARTIGLQLSLTMTFYYSYTLHYSLHLFPCILSYGKFKKKQTTHTRMKQKTLAPHTILLRQKIENELKSVFDAGFAMMNATAYEHHLVYPSEHLIEKNA